MPFRLFLHNIVNGGCCTICRLSVKGMKQFHTAETEKYAHVTFFFNGGRETAFENEDRRYRPPSCFLSFFLCVLGE